MAFCGTCGRDVGAAKFCPKCGVPVTAMPSSEGAQTTLPSGRPMSAASVMPASLPPQQSAYPRRQATGGAKTVPNSRLLIIGGIILVIVVATIVLLVSCNRVEGKYYFEYGISSSDGERYTLDDFRAAQNLGENVDDKDLFWLELTDSARYRIHMDGEADQTGAYKIEDGLLYLYEEDDREDIYVMAVMDENRIILTSGGITIFKK